MVPSLLFLCVFVFYRTLGDVNAVKVIGSEGTVALGALPLSGVVTHLQTFVTENVETLGEDRLLVSRVAAGAAQLRLKTNKHTCAPLLTSQHPYYLCLSYRTDLRA